MAESQPGGCRRIDIESLQHMRDQAPRTKSGEAEEEIVDTRDGEITVRKQPAFNHPIGMAAVPNRGDSQSQHSDRKVKDDKMAFKPIFGLPAVENHLKASESKCYQKNSQTIDPKPAVFPGIFHFPCELRRVRNNPLRQKQRDNPDRDVDKEDPAPTPVVSDPSAERRSDDRSRNDGHAVERERRRPLLRRECVHKDGLLHRSEPASSDTLQDAKKDEQA